MSTWLIWLIACFALLILELFSGAVVALCLACGCLVAAIVATFQPDWVVTTIVASVSSIAAFFLLGPAIRKLYMQCRGHHEDDRSNMDAIIGRIGRVTSEVTHQQEDKGRVQIDGDNWLAYTTEPDVPIRRGEHVIVEAYDSIILRVKRHKLS